MQHIAIFFPECSHPQNIQCKASFSIHDSNSHACVQLCKSSRELSGHTYGSPEPRSRVMHVSPCTSESLPPSPESLARIGSILDEFFPAPDDYTVAGPHAITPVISKYAFEEPRSVVLQLFTLPVPTPLSYVWDFLGNDYQRARCCIVNRATLSIAWTLLYETCLWHRAFQEVDQLEFQREQIQQTQARDDELAEYQSAWGRSASPPSLDIWMVPSS